MLRSRRFGIALGLAVTLILPATASSALAENEESPIGDSDNSDPYWYEKVDVRAPGPRAPLDPGAARHFAEMLRADLANSTLPPSERAAVRRELRALGIEADSGQLQTQVSVMAAPTYKVISTVYHVAQSKGYYCGPASGYMILKYFGMNTSQYNGAALSQAALATSSHMNTDVAGATTWTSSRFTIGLNRWAGRNMYYQMNAPSITSVKSSLRNNIGTSNRPMAADTVEFQGGYHYNGHPDRTIGHWIVARGYGNDAATSYWIDPATSYYPNAQAYFAHDTGTFTTRYLQSNGIVF